MMAPSPNLIVSIATTALLLSSGCTTLMPSRPDSGRADDGCTVLDYDPVPAVLSGTVGLEMFYGPPGFGEDPSRDFKEIVPVLVLEKRISTKGKTGNEINGDSFSCVAKIQIVNAGNLSSHLGKRVSVSGVLFQAHTGHHHTDVLIEAREIEPPPDQAVGSRFSAAMLVKASGEMDAAGELLRVLGWSKDGRIAYLRGEIPREPVGGMSLSCKIIDLKNNITVYDVKLHDAGDSLTDVNLAGKAAARLDLEGIIPGEPRLETLPVRVSAGGAEIDIGTWGNPDGSTGRFIIVKNPGTRAVKRIRLGELETITGLYRCPYGNWIVARYRSSPGNTAAPINEFAEFEDIIIINPAKDLR